MIVVTAAPATVSANRTFPKDGMTGEKIGKQTAPVTAELFARSLATKTEFSGLEDAVAAAQKLTDGPDKGAMGVWLGPGSSGVFGTYLIDLATAPVGKDYKDATPLHVAKASDATFEAHPFLQAVVDGNEVVSIESPFGR